jgi:hypothetical protein
MHRIKLVKNRGGLGRATYRINICSPKRDHSASGCKLYNLYLPTRHAFDFHLFGIPFEENILILHQVSIN